jgi:hypothetical protein
VIGLGIRRRQRGHAEFLLALDMERHPARHQRLEVRAVDEEVNHHHRFGNYVLEVIHHQQDAPVTNRGHQPAEQRRLVPDRHTKGLGHRRADQRGIAHGSEVDEYHLPAALLANESGHPERESGLANPARSSQGQQAQVILREELQHGFCFVRASNQRGEGTGDGIGRIAARGRRGDTFAGPLDCGRVDHGSLCRRAAWDRSALFEP